MHSIGRADLDEGIGTDRVDGERPANDQEQRDSLAVGRDAKKRKLHRGKQQTAEHDAPWLQQSSTDGGHRDGAHQRSGALRRKQKAEDVRVGMQHHTREQRQHEVEIGAEGAGDEQQRKQAGQLRRPPDISQGFRNQL